MTRQRAYAVMAFLALIAAVTLVGSGEVVVPAMSGHVEQVEVCE